MRNGRKRSSSALIGLAILCFLFSLTLQVGCSNLPLASVFRGQNDEVDSQVVINRGPTLVGNIAQIANTHNIKASGYGLVVGLRNTGSDIPLGEVRKQLLRELQNTDEDSLNAVLAYAGVRSVESLLASKDTAAVVLEGTLPPGAEIGDTCDVRIRTLTNDESTSLRGGYLLQTGLFEMPQFGGSLWLGKHWANAEGPILVNPTASEADDSSELKMGRILGGGRIRRSRELVIFLREGHQTVSNAMNIERVINNRFFRYEGGRKVGVAKGINDREMVLDIATPYRADLEHYVNVVRSIALGESSQDRTERITSLGPELLDPITSEQAALQLEAIGTSEAIQKLKQGVLEADPEVRFRSARALAFKDETDAAEPLAELARSNDAFRVYALAALGVMTEPISESSLMELLDGTSAETRYGAFRALKTRMENDGYVPPSIKGEQLGTRYPFNYHILNTEGTPMVHVTRSRLPELTLFGKGQRLDVTRSFTLDAGRILVNHRGGGRVVISLFSAIDEYDQERITSGDLDEVIRAIVDLGGSYPDVVQALQQASDAEILQSRFELDALPSGGRLYERSRRSIASSSSEEDPSLWQKMNSTIFWWAQKDDDEVNR
jgi:flagellar basal body P-ring protein FlgI